MKNDRSADALRVQLVFAPPINSYKFGELNGRCMPPLGIMYLASYLESHTSDVDLKLTDGLEIGYKETMEEIRKFDPQVLGLSFFTPCAQGAFRIADEVKRRRPESMVVFGGPHATALPENCLTDSAADVVAIGEGEITLLELVENYQANHREYRKSLTKIDGIAFMNGLEAVRTATRKPIPNLDDLPHPERELIDIKKYSGWYLNKEAVEAEIMLTRGCPYSCTFCSNMVWKTAKPTVRMRSPKNIVDEIEDIQKKTGVNEFFDSSDEFNVNPAWALSVCREMIDRNLKIYWKTSIRAHPLPDKLVKAMADSGCWYVLLGIESGNQETIDGIGKHITLSQVEEACRKLQKHGIKVMGLFMLYNVWEKDGDLFFEDSDMTRKTFAYMNRLSKKRLLDYVGWSVTMPYPGSKLYQIALNHNLIDPGYRGEWEKWLAGDSLIMKLPGVDKKSQVRLKTLGSLTRAKLILRERQFKLKDFSLMSKKLFKLVQNEVKTKFGKSV